MEDIFKVEDVEFALKKRRVYVRKENKTQTTIIFDGYVHVCVVVWSGCNRWCVLVLLK